MIAFVPNQWQDQQAHLYQRWAVRYCYRGDRWQWVDDIVLPFNRPPTTDGDVMQLGFQSIRLAKLSDWHITKRGPTFWAKLAGGKS